MRLSIFSDIHGDKAALERLMDQEADYYFVAGDLANWGRGLEKMGPTLARRADRVYVIPGNHESAADIAGFCATFGFKDFHSQTATLGGHSIAGLGYSNITPFGTPGEYSENEMASRLALLGSPEVLICHCPPKNTRLDRAADGQNFGSQAVRDFLEQRQPSYFYCGHIHEAAGASDRIGKTLGFNVGKQGILLDL